MSDDYATCAECYATLRIYDAEPEQVSAALDLHPTRTQREGEHWPKRADEGHRGIDAEGVVERRDDLAHADRVLGGFGAGVVCRADHLAHLQPAAGDDGRHDRGPVVAPRVAVDLRRAPELAPHHYH